MLLGADERALDEKGIFMFCVKAWPLEVAWGGVGAGRGSCGGSAFREGADSDRGCSGALTFGAVLVSGCTGKVTKRPTRICHIRLVVKPAREGAQIRDSAASISVGVLDGTVRRGRW